MVNSDVFNDDKKLNKVNQNLKLKDLEDYNLNLLYEYDDNLSNYFNSASIFFSSSFKRNAL